MEYKEKIQDDKMPLHVAVIMDGNGRWAKKKGNQRIFGHKNGVIAVRETVEAAAELGIKYLTLYAFSTENWSRPKYEVDALMSLLISTLDAELDTLMNNNVRLSAIGDIDNLPQKVSKELKNTIKKTENNSGLTLLLALNYSGRWEIVDAIKKISEQFLTKEITINDINESLICRYLQTANIPDPELMIRTSGEYRISNFLLWQLAYAEFHFTDTLWPDFRKNDFHKAIVDFQSRERRFGKTSEQMHDELK